MSGSIQFQMPYFFGIQQIYRLNFIDATLNMISRFILDHNDGYVIMHAQIIFTVGQVIYDRHV